MEELNTHDALESRLMTRFSAMFDTRINQLLWIPVVILLNEILIANFVTRSDVTLAIFRDIGVAVPMWMLIVWSPYFILGSGVALLGLLAGFAYRFLRSRASRGTFYWGITFCLVAYVLNSVQGIAIRRMLNTLLEGIG